MPARQHPAPAKSARAKAARTVATRKVRVGRAAAGLGLFAARPIAAADQETALLLRQIWRSLDDELVEVGIYYFVDAMTHAEIARIVGCSERTVGNRIERLRTTAREAATGEP